MAGNKAINPGDEIFIHYTMGRSYIMTDEEDFDDEERVTGEEWYYISRARRITNERSRAKIESTPAPLRGGDGGNPSRGPCFSTRSRGVCANLTSAAVRPARIGYPPLWQLVAYAAGTAFHGAGARHTHTGCP